jgi:hypothetical protein
MRREFISTFSPTFSEDAVRHDEKGNNQMKIKNMIKTNTMRKYRKSLSVMLASLLLASSLPVSGGTTLASTSAALAAAAGSDFVYIIRAQQSFGDVATGGTFQGEDQTYTFTLPSNLAPGTAHVMAHGKGFSNNCNRFEVNGTNLGIFAIRSNPNEFFVEMGDVPSGILRPGTNTLTIRALNANCTVGGDLDEFVISNVIFFYHVQ